MSDSNTHELQASSHSIYLTRIAIRNHLAILGGLSPQTLRQMLGVCNLDPVHSIQCDCHLCLVRHVNDWLGQGIIWIRVDCPCCIRFAVPDQNEKMLWWRIAWPGELKEVFFKSQ
ncbi:hypothetical protein H0W80_05215 [Candidatus Saccharibacteria bacterium]|nr:hypothetical protein [Candidatus Saccharibacteria bacterium]